MCLRMTFQGIQCLGSFFSGVFCFPFSNLSEESDQQLTGCTGRDIREVADLDIYITGKEGFQE